MRYHVFGFGTRSDTNCAVQPQNMARDLKFRIKKIEELYYLLSENKGAHRASDLRHCFHIHMQKCLCLIYMYLSCCRAQN